MKIAIIILAVALALFIYLFILSEISLRQEINEWAKEVVENIKLKKAITELEKKGKLTLDFCPFCGAKLDGGEDNAKQQAETDNNSATG